MARAALPAGQGLGTVGWLGSGCGPCELGMGAEPLLPRGVSSHQGHDDP